jgi:hypothetical protein
MRRSVCGCNPLGRGRSRHDGGEPNLIGASFDSTKTPLQELLARADTGKLQLTDFQRAWVWDDDRIRGLLASVSVSFSIGAVMLLETGGENGGG